MSDNIVLARYLDRDGEEAHTQDPRANAEAGEDLVAFGWVRGTRDRALMLELRKKDGSILAVGYGWLERAVFDPSQGITLYVGSQRICIYGRNLNVEMRPSIRLFEGVTRHRVSWIREADEPTLFTAGKDDTVVEQIKW